MEGLFCFFSLILLKNLNMEVVNRNSKSFLILLSSASGGKALQYWAIWIVDFNMLLGSVWMKSSHLLALVCSDWHRVKYTFSSFIFYRCQWSVWLWASWLFSEEQHYPDLEAALYPGGADPGDWLHHAHSRASFKVRFVLRGLKFFWLRELPLLVVKI